MLIVRANIAFQSLLGIVSTIVVFGISVRIYVSLLWMVTIRHVCTGSDTTKADKVHNQREDS